MTKFGKITRVEHKNCEQTLTFKHSLFGHFITGSQENLVSKWSIIWVFLDTKLHWLPEQNGWIASVCSKLLFYKCGFPKFGSHLLTSYMYIYNSNEYDYWWLYVSRVVFCPGYLDWLLDSTLHLVLFIQFIQFILKSVSVACTHVYIMYILFERWLIHLSGGYSWPVPTSVGRTLVEFWVYFNKMILPTVIVQYIDVVIPLMVTWRNIIYQRVYTVHVYKIRKLILFYSK